MKRRAQCATFSCERKKCDEEVKSVKCLSSCCKNAGATVALWLVIFLTQSNGRRPVSVCLLRSRFPKANESSSTSGRSFPTKKSRRAAANISLVSTRNGRSMEARAETLRVTSIIHAGLMPRRSSQIVGGFGFGRRRLSSQAKRLPTITAKNISKELSNRLDASAGSVTGLLTLNASENTLHARARAVRNA